MTRQIAATREFVGPWWLAVALLEAQPEEMLEPLLTETPARLVAGSEVVRVGTEAHLTLRGGELRLVEVDGNRTELTLTGQVASPDGREPALDVMAGRLARRIETALACEIGTQ